MSVDIQAEMIKEQLEEQPVQPSFYPQPAALAEEAEVKFPAEGEAGPLYYNVPMLKPPTWRWEVSSYFYLGGLSAGAYLLSRLAERFGGGKYKNLARAGTNIAAATFAPCPVLLIKDLGDPLRFYNMLRVVKPISPMNLGSWAITGYGVVLTLALIREFYAKREGSLTRKLLGLADAAGIPLAMTVATYSGVLLSTTSTPLWARNSWLGALFGASAIHNGAEAMVLALKSQNKQFGAGVKEDPTESEAVHKVNTITRLAEAVTLAGYLISLGKQSEPITKGKYAHLLWGGAVGAGLALPTILERAPTQSNKSKKWMGVAAAAAGLLGSFALRWALVYGGHPSSKDPKLAREATKAGR